MRGISRGFTLLEVLVALSILAISASAVIKQTSGSLTQLSTLKAKTVAVVLAENRMNLAIAADAFPSTGRSTEQVTFNDQRWWIHTDVSNTTDPWLRKIEVSISEDVASEAVLVSLVSYRGKF